MESRCVLRNSGVGLFQGNRERVIESAWVSRAPRNVNGYLPYAVAMAIQGMWLAVDIIGTRHTGEVFIHSAAGERVARRLKRCASELGFDRAGEAVVRAVVEATLDGRSIPAVEGLNVETHQIDAADGTPVGLILWVGSRKPNPRPTYNAWVLDMTAKTTRTSGDDPGMIGDGRQAGEERHVQHLFTWLNPEDAFSMVGGYYDALTGDDGDLIQSYWSLRPGGDEYVHMWSSCRLRVTNEGNQRHLYGLTLKIEHRELEANISSLIRFSNATLLLVEARDKIPLTTIGRLAPLGEDRITQVMEQVNLDELTRTDGQTPSDQKLEINGERFIASTFALHSAREKHGDPVAIILLVEEDAVPAPV